MLGPGDLRVSLGLPSKKVGEYDHPRFLDAIDDLVTVSKRHRKPLMTVACKIASQSNAWIKDFALLLTSADIFTLTDGFRADLRKMEELLRREEVDVELGSDKRKTEDARVQATGGENGLGAQWEKDRKIANGNGMYSTNGNGESLGKRQRERLTNGNGKVLRNDGSTNGRCHLMDSCQKHLPSGQVMLAWEKGMNR